MKRTVIVLSVLMLSGALAFAKPPEKENDGNQPRPPGPGAGMRMGMGRDPMMENLFPPPVLREAEEEIGLTEEQKNSIKEIFEKSRENFEELQKKLRAEMDELSKLLKPAKVDVEQAREQLDKVLAAENEIKKAHLVALIQVKNILTAEQQDKLRAWMKEHRPERPPGGGQGRGPGGPNCPLGRGQGKGQGQQPPQPPQE